MVLEARLAKLRARLAHSPAPVLVRLDHVACFIGNAHNRRVKEWEIIANRLSKAGWRWGWVSNDQFQRAKNLCR